MPIKRVKFFQKKIQIKRINNEHPVISFLKINSDKAFSVKEMARITKMNDSTIRSILSKLMKKKLIIHRKPYYIWKNVPRDQQKRKKK